MDTTLTRVLKGTILVVDDTPANLQLLSKTLIEQGYSVRGVVNGEMALRVARTALPDIILLDIKMPGMDGYEVCKILKSDSRTHTIPIIFLTASNDVADIVKAFAAGGADYITKPFQTAEVLARIENQIFLKTATEEIQKLNAELEQRVRLRTEELRQRNLELQQSEARFRLIAENMSDLVCLHSPDGGFVYLSPSCETLLGFQPEELINTYPQALCHPEDLERVVLETSQPILQGESASVTYRVRKKSGDYIWLETLAKPIMNPLGQIVQVQTTSRDVTQRVLAEQQLSHDALHDTLTDLPNRALFMERVELALGQLMRTDDYQFAVLFIDLDRFKVINDSLGHLVGDRLLVAIAALLKGCLRATDIVARLGGDEFTILLDDIQDFTDATRIAERIQDQLRSPFCLEDQIVSITASIGIVLSSKGYSQGVDMLRDADIAMYRAKAAGKARYEIFDKEMHAQAVRLLQLESDLQQALQRNELRVYYQPIFFIETGQLVGFETLIRWQHPQRGVVLPDEFVAIAEDSGLIVPIGEWTLRQACHQLKIWHNLFPQVNDLMMSINLASKQIRYAHFLQQLDAILNEAELEGHHLKLEITEGTLIDSTSAITETLMAIRSRNIQLSIDDFGIGYSSLSYLSRFPINTLKIDRSFIKNLDQNENLGIVRAIVTLAHTLGMSVVAEGVETQAQLDELKQLKCEFGQGYLFAPALDADAAEALVRRQCSISFDPLLTSDR